MNSRIKHITLALSHAPTQKESTYGKNTYMFKTGNGSCCKAIAIDVATPAETFHRDSCQEKVVLFKKLLISHIY